MANREFVRMCCRWMLGTADYRASVEPYIFGSRISGTGGAYPPSISVTIFRNGQRLARSIAFRHYCLADEYVVGVVRIDESANSGTHRIVLSIPIKYIHVLHEPSPIDVPVLRRH